MDIKEAVVMSEDTASKQAIGTNHKSARFMMYTNVWNAQWAADRIIAESSYPLASVSFESNRKLFRYQPGDVFKLTYNRYSETLVCRVMSINEEDLLTGTIIVNAVEDASYIGKLPICGESPIADDPVDPVMCVPLYHFGVMEAPYVSSGDDIQIMVTAAREVGIEIGYSLFVSLDGDTYTKVKNITTFATYGVLTSEYPADTFTIDDTTGFDVTIITDAGVVQSISRNQLFTGLNTAILGDEIITFETVTPYGADNKYKIEGVYRGRYGTDKIAHSIGEDFYFVGVSRYELLESTEFTLGSTLYFKAVPYSSSDSETIELAEAQSITLTGVARTPYNPTNLRVNDIAVTPAYTDDCNITWSTRVRGDGAGLGNPDYCTDVEDVWEGLFEVRAYVSDILVRTTSDIDDDNFTYTAAMNISDNGSLASEITFWLRNYNDTGGQIFYSDWVTITVVKI